MLPLVGNPKVGNSEKSSHQDCPSPFLVAVRLVTIDFRSVGVMILC